MSPVPNLSIVSKLTLLGALYFSQGLPFGFFTQALPVLLREKGYTLAQVGLSSLLALPWALKFLWAPAVDRYSLPGFGRRKSWIVPLQFLSALTLLVLALTSDAQPLSLMMVAVFLLNALAATQDIATDGLAVEMLTQSERGWANGLQVAGYRVGMIVGGGVLLILHDRLGSSATFIAMAALTALATLPVLLTAEPRAYPSEPLSVSKVDELSLADRVHFLRRPGTLRLLVLLASYKAGDAFATSMLRPFLIDAGLTLEDIGWLLGTLGFVAGLFGALCGGLLVNRFGRKSALLGFGLLQSLTVAGYASLAIETPSLHGLYLLCGAEHFAGGMATAALFTCMMDWCSKETTATDYAVQASTVVIATGAASALAGFSAQAFGYFGHFCLAATLSLASLALVQRYFPHTAQT